MIYSETTVKNIRKEVKCGSILEHDHFESAAKVVLVTARGGKGVNNIRVRVQKGPRHLSEDNCGIEMNTERVHL